MILGNFKNYQGKEFIYLRWFLALVFLSAGIFRIIFPEAGVAELSALGLPLFLRWPLMVFEILSGLALIFQRFLRPVLAMLTVFIVFALFWTLLTAGQKLFISAGELFVFDATPTDWFLHAIFLGMMLLLLKHYRGRI